MVLFLTFAIETEENLNLLGSTIIKTITSHPQQQQQPSYIVVIWVSGGKGI